MGLNYMLVLFKKKKSIKFIAFLVPSKMISSIVNANFFILQEEKGEKAIGAFCPISRLLSDASTLFQ